MSVLGPTSDFVRDNLPAVRRKAGVAFVDGAKMAEEALAGAWPCRHVAMTEEFHATAAGKRLRMLAGTRSVPVHYVSAKAMERLSDAETAPGAGVVVVPAVRALSKRDVLPARIAVLDRIADPGNAGTLLRTAASMGFAAVLTAGGVSPANEKFLRAAAGAAFREGALYLGGSTAELSDLLRDRGARVVALLPRAERTLRQAAAEPNDRPLALVVGNESRGLDPKEWPGAEGVRIPMASDIESLNAAVSGAIAMYEFAR